MFSYSAWEIGAINKVEEEILNVPKMHKTINIRKNILKNTVKYFLNFIPAPPVPHLGHVHSCRSDSEKLTRLWEHNGGCPPAPRTPHIDGAV